MTSSSLGTEDERHAETGAGAKKLHDVAAELKQQGRKLGQEVKHDAEDLLRSRQHSAAEYLSDICTAVRQSAEALEAKGRSGSASALRHAADEVDRFGTQVSERAPGELLREAEALARRNPAIAMGAALLVGFAAVRFLKSAGTEASAAGSNDSAGVPGGFSAGGA